MVAGALPFILVGLILVFGFIAMSGDFSPAGTARLPGVAETGWGGFAMIVFGIAFAALPFIPFVAITRDSITVVSNRGRRTLARRDIACYDSVGLESRSPSVTLYPSSQELKPVIIPGTFKTDDHFRAWVRAFPTALEMNFNTSRFRD